MRKERAEEEQAGEPAADARDAGHQSPPPTWLSWTIRGFSVLLIVGLLGYLVVATVRPTRQPTITFAVQQDKIQQRGGSWALPVDVTNEGTVSIHALTVNAVLTQLPDKPKSSLTILLLGPGQVVTTTFWFEQDPRGKGEAFRVEGYVLP